MNEKKVTSEKHTFIHKDHMYKSAVGWFNACEKQEDIIHVLVDEDNLTIQVDRISK